MKRIVVDTNIYSALTKCSLIVKEIIENAEEIIIPVFVMAELLYGFRNGSKEAYNRELFHEFLKLRGIQIQQTTKETADIYAMIKHDLKKAGTPIPINDIWIAATAVETASVVVTYDKHFNSIMKCRVQHLK